MKYVYAALVLALILGGYYFFTVQEKSKMDASGVPEGYHRMEDGTMMKNDNASMETQEDTVPQSGAKVTGDGEPDNEQPSVTLDPYAKVFTVKGVNYGYDVKEIKVKEGDTVTINFISSDGFHDWVVDEFDAATKKVQPGVPTSVTFVADKKGTFEYYCSVGQHRVHGMVGNLIVE
jgi:plastocyanin